MRKFTEEQNWVELRSANSGDNKNVLMNLKTCVLPVTTNVLETMDLNKNRGCKLQNSRLTMERQMPGVSLRGRISSTEIMKKHWSRSSGESYDWFGHMAKWTACIAQWMPQGRKKLWQTREEIA